MKELKACAVRPTMKPHSSGGLFAMALLVAFLFIMAKGDQAIAQLQVVALSGQQAAGTDPGVVFSRFNALSINNLGQVAYGAVLSGPGVNSANDAGMWHMHSSGTTLTVREGMLAPGAPAGAVFSSISQASYPLLNDSEQIAFRGVISGPGVMSSNDVGIWLSGSGGLELLVSDGMSLPGISGSAIVTFNFPALNDAGQLAVGARIENGSNEYYAQIIADSNGLGVVVREGAPVPEDPSYRFSSIIPFPEGSAWSRINALGQTVFSGDARNPSIPGSSLHGVWLGSPGSLGSIVISGDAAPGTESGVLFSGFETESLNDQGEVVFSATLSGPGLIGGANDGGIWMGDATGVSLVARTGDLAPGAPPGFTFAQLVNSLKDTQNIINSAGKVAFSAGLRPPGSFSVQSSGIFIGEQGALSSIAIEGEQAPGLPAGITFGSFLAPTWFSMNAAGQVVFAVDISNSGDPFTKSQGIWVQDRMGNLVNVAYVGQEIVLGPGDTRIITGLDVSARSGNEDGRQTSINDLGQVVFSARFDDGSAAILISNVAAVPEPEGLLHGVLGLLAIGALGLSRRWRGYCSLRVPSRGVI